MDAVSTGSQAASITCLINHTVGSDGSRCLVVCAGTADSNDVNLPITNIKWGGTNLTKVRSDHTGTNDCRSEIWKLDNPVSGASTITITATGSVWVSGIVNSWANVDQTNSLDNHIGRSGSSATVSDTITAVAPFTVVIDAVCAKATRTLVSSGFTDLGQVHGTTSQHLAASYQIVRGSQDILDSQTIQNGTNWNISMMTLKSINPTDPGRTVRTDVRTLVNSRTNLTVGQ